MLKNDQKWMFTNKIVAYTIGFLQMEKRFPKDQKFRPTPPISCFAQKPVQDPK